MAMPSTGRSGYPSETYPRRAPSPFDDPRAREARTRRMSPPPARYDHDDGPPMKRSRGGPPMSRGGRGRGGFAPRRGRSSRRF